MKKDGFITLVRSIIAGLHDVKDNQGLYSLMMMIFDLTGLGMKLTPDTYRVIPFMALMKVYLEARLSGKSNDPTVLAFAMAEGLENLLVEYDKIEVEKEEKETATT